MKFILPIFLFTSILPIFCFSQQNVTVISKTASFREKPNKTAKIIFTVKRGAKFHLESETHKNGWYNVSVLEEDLPRLLKEKYPEYNDVDEDELVSRLLKKYPSFGKGWIHGNDIQISNSKQSSFDKFMSDRNNPLSKRS